METSNRKAKTSRKKSGLSNETNRKAAHNAVECRRKLKITQLVDQLSVLVEPSCRCGKETKVDVLSKVVDKIHELEIKNEELKTSINGYCIERLSETETDLQQQLAVVMVEHISLLFQSLHHKSITNEDHQNTQNKRKNQEAPIGPTNERCGFGVADLLESYDRPSHSLLGRNIGSDQSQDTRRGDGGTGIWERVSNDDNHTQCSPASSMSNNCDHNSALSTHLIVPSHTYNHMSDNTWEQERTFPPPPLIPVPHGVSYYPDVEPHPQPHPSQYLDDPNRTSVSSNVWRPYNDQQQSTQQVCMSSQVVNTSFLMEQLLEKLL